MTSSEVAKELRADWMVQITGLGFPLAGYLTKHNKVSPQVALFVNAENRDSAHVARIAGKNLFVFKTRFTDGFAFETANTVTASMHGEYPQHAVFRFPQILVPADLYVVHRYLREQFEKTREAVVAASEGELADFILRSGVLRQHIMLRRGYRLDEATSTYVFTFGGAVREAFLLTWPVKPIREAIFRHKTSKELKKLGFRFDRGSGRLLAS